jgi:hypothetical protein
MKPTFWEPATSILPTWQELKQETLAHRASMMGRQSSRPHSSEVAKTQSWLLAMIKFAVSALPRKSRLARLSTWSAEELALFLSQQAYLNQWASKNEAQSSCNLFFGSHNQLPCTSSSLERRLAVVEQHIPPSGAILILGDDDLQSVSLARRGYRDITVVEIDPAIASHIRDISKSEDLGISVECRNIQAAGSELRRKYHATLIDPPTDPDGLEVFLSGVFRLNVKTAGNMLFVSTNPLAHQRNGYEKLRSVLNEQFVGLARYSGINVYEIPRIPKAVLSIGMRLTEPTLSKPIHFYCADLLVLKARG